MYALKCYQIHLLIECLITQLKHVMAFNIMYAWTWCHKPPFNESLIKHITRIRAFTIMDELICYQIGLLIYYTIEMYKGAHHYV
jgi:hypothetical protein